MSKSKKSSSLKDGALYPVSLASIWSQRLMKRGKHLFTSNQIKCKQICVCKTRHTNASSTYVSKSMLETITTTVTRYRMLRPHPKECALPKWRMTESDRDKLWLSLLPPPGYDLRIVDITDIADIICLLLISFPILVMICILLIFTLTLR